MNISNITTDVDDNISLCNCTNNENDNNVELTITPLLTLITIVPCGISLVCLISVMTYTLMKALFKK